MEIMIKDASAESVNVLKIMQAYRDDELTLWVEHSEKGTASHMVVVKILDLKKAVLALSYN